MSGHVDELGPEWTTIRYDVDLQSNIRESESGMTALEAGEWVIDALIKDLAHRGEPLGAWDLRTLRLASLDLNSYTLDAQPALTSLISRSVAAARRLIDYSLTIGEPSVQVREGLWMPIAWEKRYQIMYQTNFPWLVSALMQWALLGGPGEKAWNSRKPGRPSQLVPPVSDAPRYKTVLPFGVPALGLALLALIIPSPEWSLAFASTAIVLAGVGAIRIVSSGERFIGQWSLWVGGFIGLASALIAVIAMTLP